MNKEQENEAIYIVEHVKNAEYERLYRSETYFSDESSYSDMSTAGYLEITDATTKEDILNFIISRE